jgi:hypothetical protein
MMGEFRGTQKEDDRGPLSIQSSLVNGVRTQFFTYLFIDYLLVIKSFFVSHSFDVLKVHCVHSAFLYRMCSKKFMHLQIASDNKSLFN